MEVLQQGFRGMLATMSDPHSPASGHDPVPRHDHHQDHDHEHSHGSDSGVLSRLRHILRPHSHDAGDQIDAAISRVDARAAVQAAATTVPRLVNPTCMIRHDRLVPETHAHAAYSARRGLAVGGRGRSLPSSTRDWALR